MRVKRAFASVSTFERSCWNAGQRTSRCLKCFAIRDRAQGLERIGAIREDDGWLEAEVLEWAIEEFENVS
jgi:hypothetical protein